MLAYRIADSRHPIFDSTAAMLHSERWNSIGHRFIYAAETYAGALLEVLATPTSHTLQRIIEWFESKYRTR